MNDEIKKLIESKKAVVGTKKTLKGLKTGKISKIFVSSNAKKEVVDDLKQYAKLSSVKIIELNVKNDELGMICKKPFSISILGVQK